MSISCILCEKLCSLQLVCTFGTAYFSSKAVSMHYWKCYCAMLNLFFSWILTQKLAALPQRRTSGSPKPAVYVSLGSAWSGEHPDQHLGPLWSHQYYVSTMSMNSSLKANRYQPPWFRGIPCGQLTWSDPMSPSPSVSQQWIVGWVSEWAGWKKKKSRSYPALQMPGPSLYSRHRTGQDNSCMAKEHMRIDTLLRLIFGLLVLSYAAYSLQNHTSALTVALHTALVSFLHVSLHCCLAVLILAVKTITTHYHTLPWSSHNHLSITRST